MNRSRQSPSPLAPLPIEWGEGDFFLGWVPRVGPRTDQPWALHRNAVGVDHREVPTRIAIGRSTRKMAKLQAPAALADGDKTKGKSSLPADSCVQKGVTKAGGGAPTLAGEGP